MIALRDARPDDAERVYAWNCAADVRAVSGDPRPVALADHVRWYRRRLRDGAIWIIESDGEPLGRTTGAARERLGLRLRHRLRVDGFGNDGHAMGG